MKVIGVDIGGTNTRPSKKPFTVPPLLAKALGEKILENTF